MRWRAGESLEMKTFFVVMVPGEGGGVRSTDRRARVVNPEQH